MGIRFFCPNGHKLNVKEFQAGRKGICPYCGAKFQIPLTSTRKSSHGRNGEDEASEAGARAVEAAQADPPATAGPAPVIGAGAQPAAVRPATSQPVSPVSTPAQPIGSMPPGAQGAAAIPGALPGAVPATSIPASPNQAPAAQAPLPTSQPAMAAQGVMPGGVGAAPVAGPTATAWQGAPAAAASTMPPPSPAPDPLAEAPQMVWYVRPPSGGQFGPAMGEVMRSWIVEGRVSGDSLVWREGWRDWQEAGEVFPQLRTGQADQALKALAPSRSTAGSHAPRPPSRRQSKSTQMMVITLLVMAVITLFVVFVWVLTY